MRPVPLLITLAALLIVSTLCSMTEAAYLAVNKVRLRHLMQRGAPAAKIVYQLLTKLDRLIATLLVTNTVVNIAMSVLATMLFVAMFGFRHGTVIATVALTLVLLVVGEITPKLFAAAHADRVTLIMARPMQVFMGLMRPLVRLFTATSDLIMRALGERRIPRSPLMTEEELKVMIEMGREAGVVAERELRMLHRIFAFDDTLVRDVMVRREEITGLEITEPPDAAIDLLVEEGHSRIPVYRGSVDRIEGILYSRDLLAVARHGGLFVLTDLIRPAYFVPETKRVAELLADFQRLQIQIAIVRGPQDRTLGLVTLEDLLEEIVGEIHEEIPEG